MMHDILQPAAWPRASGYANGIAAEGKMIFVAGQVGWNERHEFRDDLAAQISQALGNIVAVLAEGGAAPAHVVRMTWYVTDIKAYLDPQMQKRIRESYTAAMGKYYPAMTLVEVSALAEPKAKVEIEVTAVIPR